MQLLVCVKVCVCVCERERERRIEHISKYTTVVYTSLLRWWPLPMPVPSEINLVKNKNRQNNSFSLSFNSFFSAFLCVFFGYCGMQLVWKSENKLLQLIWCRDIRNTKNSNECNGIYRVENHRNHGTEKIRCFYGFFLTSGTMRR